MARRWQKNIEIQPSPTRSGKAVENDENLKTPEMTS